MHQQTNRNMLTYFIIEKYLLLILFCIVVLSSFVSKTDQTFKNDKATQTELKLSHSTPRKVAPRRKCDTAEKRAKRAKLKFKDKTIEDITFNDFQKLL